jgi:ribosomal protein S6--L-glutamate ligase
MVMEVNSSPGLEGIEKATGLDVAAKLYEFIEKKNDIAQPRKLAVG